MQRSANFLDEGGVLRLTAAALLLALLLPACSNAHRMDKGPLTAYGHKLERGSDPLYYNIGIDVLSQPDSHVLRALVRLTPEAEPMSIAELTPEFVSLHLPKFQPPKEWPQEWKEKALKEHAYSGGGFHIKYTPEGRLERVGLCSGCYGGPFSPIVGSPDGRHFHALPLTQAQFTQVFGPADWSGTVFLP
jgi:hypothetical protein